MRMTLWMCLMKLKTIRCDDEWHTYYQNQEVIRNQHKQDYAYIATKLNLYPIFIQTGIGYPMGIKMPRVNNA